MDKTPLTRAIEEAVAIKMKAVDLLIESFIEPLANLGNPEKLIGKRYEEWTPQDLLLVSKIYGSADGTPLSNLIFDKEYKRVLSLEEHENART